MPRAMQKLVRNGNAVGVSIPRPILITLGWLPGQLIVIELLDDDSLRLRLPVERDVAPLGAPRIVYDQPGVVQG
jgi:antitoxin component of MazEF toxin-antitoxin module